MFEYACQGVEIRNVDVVIAIAIEVACMPKRSVRGVTVARSGKVLKVRRTMKPTQFWKFHFGAEACVTSCRKRNTVTRLGEDHLRAQPSRRSLGDRHALFGTHFANVPFLPAVVQSPTTVSKFPLAT